MNRLFDRRQSCPSCDSGEAKRLYQCKFGQSPIKDYLDRFYAPVGQIEFEYLEDELYVLRECNNCQCVYQEYIPGEILTYKLYEAWINPELAFIKNSQHDLEYYQKNFVNILALINFLNKKPHQLRFLDFGMGWGNWARTVNALGGVSYGTELSQTRINFAKSQGIKVIDYDEIPKERFDVINIDQVLEHVPNPRVMLVHLVTSLKPEGLIRIGVPNGDDIKRRIKVLDWTASKNSRNSLNPVSPLEHLNCFNTDSLVAIASLCNLTPVTIPVNIWYASSVPGLSIKEKLKFLLRPLYKGRNQQTITLFFKRFNK